MRYDLSELVSQHRDLVYHVIVRMIPESQTHDDLFQETFLNVARNISSFRRESKLSTWVYRVAQNTCLSHIRRLRREPTLPLEEWLDEESNDPRSSPVEEAVEGSDARGRLNRALDHLPLKYRMPIVLYYLEEMSYKEIAQCLSIPMGTVKTNMHRGLMRLRIILGEDSDACL